MTKVISICNHKGGVGKTTSALNIGAALHKMKKKVLLIDLDPQANLSQSVGLENQKYNIYGVMKGDHEFKPIAIKTGFDIVPSVLDLSGAELELSAVPGREKVLSKQLETIHQNYDFVLIDCPPSLGLLTINALSSSHEVIIPLQVQYLATQGLSRLLYIIGLVRERLNSKLEMGGIILTQYNKRKVLNRVVENTMKTQFQEKVFKTLIRENIDLAEASMTREDIFDYNRNCNGAKDYYALSMEIAKKYKKIH